MNGTENELLELDWFCYDNNLVTSQGVFLGDDPLEFSLPVLLLQMSAIFLATRAIHYFLQKIGQPQEVSQILVSSHTSLSL